MSDRPYTRGDLETLKQWDTQYANAEERQLAAEQNRLAGWEDWFDEQPTGSARVPATVAC